MNAPLRWMCMSVSAMVLVAAMSVPVLAAPSRATEADRRAVRDYIASMTDVERERLHRHLREYKKLSTESRADLWELHDALKQDAELNGGKLGAVMRNYHAWLTQLSPAQRQDIRNTTDLGARRTLIKRLFEELRKQHEEEELESDRGPIGILKRISRVLPLLTKTDLDSILEVIDKRIRESSIPEARRRKLDEFQGRERLVASMLLALQLDREFEIASARPGAARQLAVVNTQELIEKIESVSTRESLGRENPMRQKVMLVTSIIRAFDEHYPSEKPTEKQLAEVFTNLPASERDDVSRRSFEQARARLEAHFVRSHPERFPAESIRNLLMQNQDRFGQLFPGGERPSGAPGAFPGPPRDDMRPPRKDLKRDKQD